jgi:hypothetical protein
VIPTRRVISMPARAKPKPMIARSRASGASTMVSTDSRADSPKFREKTAAGLADVLIDLPLAGDVLGAELDVLDRDGPLGHDGALLGEVDSRSASVMSAPDRASPRSASVIG